MHKSISKVEAIRDKQKSEMKEYSDNEIEAIDVMKKRQHYEQIRISEERKSLDEQKEEAEKELQEIDDLVYEDTKQHQIDKHQLNTQIDDLNEQIEEMLRIIERKKKEKEMLLLERQVHDNSIETAKMNYKDRIDKATYKQEKVGQKLKTNELDLGKLNADKKDLEDLEAQFEQQMNQFEDELKNLSQMQEYLNTTSQEIDDVATEMKAATKQQSEIEKEIHEIK